MLQNCHAETYEFAMLLNKTLTRSRVKIAMLYLKILKKCHAA